MMSEGLRLSRIRAPAAASAQRRLKITDQHPSRSIATLIIGPFGFYSEGLRSILEDHQYRNIIQLPHLDCSNHLQDTSPKLIIFTDAAHGTELAEIVSALRSRNSAARIVVLVDENDPDRYADAMSIPAHAFLSAGISPSALITALDVVFGDGGVLSINFAKYLASRRTPYEPKPLKAAPTEQRLFLSGREADILRCLTDGISNKHIARQFGIAESTVKIHVKSILRKINVQNRTQAAIWALGHASRPEQAERVGAKPDPSLADAH
ncbi:LuxR C-terminal-related transcriptional regulator [Methylobacterium sp. HMF5984]|uniref:LuxR C-terminal-related transcriptional regulator n=1 Tax=Methylobacterium sp. HMF5984 TaxID=3367370 RepID=UPI003851B70E